MDAVLHATVVLLACTAGQATFKTPNFVISAPTHEFAQVVGEAAETYRRELAIAWVGREFPRWSSPCPVSVKVGDYGAAGATTFNFDRGEVFGWKMNVQGTAERILDSVLPHEVNHTILATHFRRPLPRWADEGAASLIEHESERMRLKKIHEQVLRTTKRIPLRRLLPMTEYPQDTQQVLTLYAEGYSLADYLIQQSDRATYLRFLTTAHQRGWDAALKEHYGYTNVDVLERDLNQWVMAGSPDLSTPDGIKLAGARVPGRTPGAVVRGQSPDVLAELGSPGHWPVGSSTPPARPAVRSREGLERSVTATPQLAARRSRAELVPPALTVSQP